MAKEPNTPKAVNIIRPTGNTNYGLLNPNTSHNNNGSIISNGSQRRPGSVLSGLSASSTGSRKPPRIAHAVMKEKPGLNIYHPLTRKPSHDEFSSRSSSSSRPSIEIYKPQQTQQPAKNMKPYISHPSFSSSDPSLQPMKVLGSNRPRSSSYKQPANYRSVLGVINTPAMNEGNRVIHEVSVDSPTDRKVRSVLKYASSEDEEDDEEEEEEDMEDGSESDIDDYSDNEEQDNHSMISDHGDDAEDQEEEEEEVVEARVNRKIEDLELTVKSLLTVNAMLEATVRKQASQLNQYKKSGHVGSLDDIDSIVSHEELIGHVIAKNMYTHSIASF
ncbi:hypothetical protein BD560DRAFT_174636 [Blakeslea trispora]|nr:hypothetical protein BD560DRAFT_174636 [Blakeslea trispora]